MRWIWDPRKDHANKRKHRVSFTTAQQVFANPLAVSQIDPDPDEQRWITIGIVGGVTILVVHTWTELNGGTGDEGGRIISARKARQHERKAYEEGTF